MKKKKKVVILGGGFAGSIIAKQLEKEFDTILIDTKPYFEYTPGILRTIIKPEHIKKIQRLHNHYLQKTTIQVTNVVRITRKEVILQNNQRMSYDFLVISTGSTYELPIKDENAIPASRADTLRSYHQRLENAKKVIIIGGGIVGVELAAEIVTHYPQKEIVLIHSKKRLMQRNRNKTITYVESFLTKRGVQLLLGKKVVAIEKDNVTLDDATIEPYDLAFVCTGIKPNFTFMKKTLSTNLDKRGFIKVNENLQLKGIKNIFVAGDVAGITEEKTAQTAEKHAKVVIENIKNLERNKKLIEYSSRKRPTIISLGPYTGILETDNATITGLLPAVLKVLIEDKRVRKRA